MSDAEPISIPDLLELLTEVFLYEDGTLQESTRRDDIEGWDSLGVLTLKAEFDEKFDVLLSDDVLDGCESIADLVAILDERNLIAR